MKTSDYIVDYIISNGITDIFGYPGGMVTHLMDSLGKRSAEINTHITYNEQAAAFAACGYAQASGKTGVAFATSGPGATNMITGIGNAYYDSIPVVFITGQVNTFESKGESLIRQKGFQEANIVPMVKEITKATYYIKEPEEVGNILEEAFHLTQSGRKGPVLIDIPMNIFRSEIAEVNTALSKIVGGGGEDDSYVEEVTHFEKCLEQELHLSKRPCLVIGNGIKIARQVDNLRGMLRACPLPVVSSMIAVDIVPEGHGLEGTYYGFLGAYGNRTANFVVAKSDLLICIGTRLDVRQVGGKRENFAPNARIMRVDIDEEELKNIIRSDDMDFKIDVHDAISILRKVLMDGHYEYENWLDVCQIIKKQVKYIDEKEPNRIVNKISRIIPDDYSLTVDVGQHMVWVAQSFRMKPNQRAFFSGGMGSMGYALPAAIGVYYATRKPVICFSGDGSIQMNIQELQFLQREQIPIIIVVFNNESLGMIRHFQEMYFDSQYFFTLNGMGYTTPDFIKIANAYGITAHRVNSDADLEQIDINCGRPMFIEIPLKGNTYVFPKLEFGKPNQDQEPLLDRSLYNYLMEL